MYGRMPGYEASDLSDEQFQRKRQLCQDVLNLMDKIMPGQTRKRGMMLYEIHLPLVMLTNRYIPTYAMTLRTCAEIFRQINCYLFCRNLQRGPGCGVPPETLKENLKKGFECLKEGLDILDREPEGSFEKKIVEGSKDSITQLDDWVKMVCSSL